MRFPFLAAALGSLLSISLLLSMHAACGAADFDAQTIKNASVDDIKKWLKVDVQGHGLMSQWKLLATRTEKLSWWTEIIGYQPVIVRKRRAAWDPNKTGGKEIIDDSRATDEKKFLFMVVAELPSNYSDSTLIGINLVSLDVFDR